MQTSTIIVRGIATGHINLQEVSKVIFRGIKVGIILGLIYGLFLGILVNFYFTDYHSPLMLGIVVGTSIFTSMSVACLVASVSPVFIGKTQNRSSYFYGPFCYQIY